MIEIPYEVEWIYKVVKKIPIKNQGIPKLKTLKGKAA